MKKYLSNDICDFEIISSWDRSKKYNILSTCFFKMNSQYKNFDIYINGLKNLIKLLDSQSKYYLRIFIDEHIKQDKSIYSLLINSDKIQIVLFKCSNYIESNYHIDVFGALVRLFPIFDFDNNDSLNVIVIDIDLNLEDLNKLKIIFDYTTSEKEIIGAGMIERMLINNYQPHYYCYLFAVYNFKFDKSIIVNFIKNAHNIKNVGLYNKRLKPFGYGTDELFLNEFLMYYNNCKYIKNIKIGILLKYDINWFLYFYKKELLVDMASKTYSNLKFILGKFYKSNMSSEQMFNFIDKKTYRIKSSDLTKIYLSKRFVYLINVLFHKKSEWFSFEHIELIKKYFSTTIDCLAIFYYDPMNLNILDVKILKKNIVD